MITKKILILIAACLIPLVSSANLTCNSDCEELIKLSRKLPVLSFNRLDMFKETVIENKVFACRLIGNLEAETRHFRGADSHEYLKLINDVKIFNDGLAFSLRRDAQHPVTNDAHHPDSS